MKIIILILSLSSFSSLAGGGKFFCSLKHSKRIIPIATQHSTNDKNRHCTVSCMLTLKCPASEVLMVGILKEFKDVFGPGEPDVEDIKADRYGISLVKNDRAQTDLECLEQCDLRY